MSIWKVSGAGDDSYNGDYHEAGTFNGVPYYVHGSGDATRYLYRAFAAVGPGYYVWRLNTTLLAEPTPSLGDPYYGALDAELPANPWSVGTGTEPAPTLAEIGYREPTDDLLEDYLLLGKKGVDDTLERRGKIIELADGASIAAGNSADYEIVTMRHHDRVLGQVPYRVIQLAVYLDVGTGSESVSLSILVSHDGTDWYNAYFRDLSTSGGNLVKVKTWTADQAREALLEFRGAWPYIKVHVANDGDNACTLDLVASVV